MYEVTYDVEREIVVPWETVEPDSAVTAMPAALALVAREALEPTLAKRVPLLEEHREMGADMGLELEDALLREDVGDDLALARMLGARAGVEEPTLDGHERVIEVGLEGSGAVPVHDLERVGVGDGQMVGRDAHICSCRKRA